MSFTHKIGFIAVASIIVRGFWNETRTSFCDSGVENAKFLKYNSAKLIKSYVGTPLYVYDEKCLIDQAQKALHFPNAFGITVRFAMKACPNATILRMFASYGVCFDASSGFEVIRAIRAGIDPWKISLSSQELPADFELLIKKGIKFNACSLKQLAEFGRLFPGQSCGVRFNPGQGSGGTGKTVCYFDFNCNAFS
jgi:diaminopimelate decarboxylase